MLQISYKQVNVNNYIVFVHAVLFYERYILHESVCM